MSINQFASFMNLEGSGERRLVGFNTDWVGMQKPILRLLAKKPVDGSFSGVGLVIGAGERCMLHVIYLLISILKTTKSLDEIIHFLLFLNLLFVVETGGTARAACFAVVDMGERLCLH